MGRARARREQAPLCARGCDALEPKGVRAAARRRVVAAAGAAAAACQAQPRDLLGDQQQRQRKVKGDADDDQRRRVPPQLLVPPVQRQHHAARKQRQPRPNEDGDRVQPRRQREDVGGRHRAQQQRANDAYARARAEWKPPPAAS
jgi:hypothetical protein